LQGDVVPELPPEITVWTGEEELLAVLLCVVDQACTTKGAELDSWALSAYARAMHRLAESPCPTPARSTAKSGVEAATSDPDGSPPITRVTLPSCRAHYPGGPVSLEIGDPHQENDKCPKL
jgi:hypothetical protein